MYKWLQARSIFSLLLMTTLCSTAILAFVLIFAFQRIADEHPRRDLTKTIFSYVIAANLQNGTLPKNFGAVSVDIIPLSSLEKENKAYQILYKHAQNDRDHIAIGVIDGHYVAVSWQGDNLITISNFSQPLSEHAKRMLLLVIVVLIIMLLVNFLIVRYLTKPFSLLKKTVLTIQQGDIAARVPLTQMFGEYRLLGEQLNKMLEELRYVHEVRRHMLLALPHELKTPLTRLKVRKDLVDNTALREDILRDITHIERILDAILYTEKVQTEQGKLPFERIKVDEMLEMLSQEFNGDISLQLEPKSIEFISNYEILAILCRNLMANAVFYGLGKPVIINAKLLQKGLFLEIKDHGAGIAPEQLPYITEPFWRVDPSRQRKSGGYGLGLYLCKTIVDVLNGSLKIESELGKGTTVCVHLPLRGDLSIK